ncbi:MAG: serine/threonine protein kinase [Candidatus Obscuribacterales bacterium]|nr:serine/threonine protein kinase [Candidatus Obscuribacterales bacterium]
MGEQKIDLAVSEIGTIFEEKYEILSVLGRGANGIVYKAKHVLLSQLVALKIINESSSDREVAAQRFQKEAALLSSFDHPNIVKLNAYGLLPDGRQYMALEFVEGRSLSDLIERDGALECEPAIDIFLQICSGLEYSHERGAIHRDIKPDNVMIDIDSKAKILDFGIFKSLDPSSQSLTKTGYLLGSANYMSPEQCKQQELDQRSDLYSLGCLMYETLVGQPPMQDASEMSIMSNQLQKVIDNVPAKHGISSELQGVILKCLEKNSSNRFQSAKELAIALEACKNAPLIATAIEKSSKSKMLLPILAAFVFISAFLVGIYFWKKSETKKELSELTAATETSPYETGRLPPPDNHRTPKATEQREAWIKNNVSHADPKILFDQYMLAWHSRKTNKMTLPPPFGELVRDRLRAALKPKHTSYSQGYYGLIRDLAHLSSMISDKAGVKEYISMLEVKGETALEANRLKALNRAVMQVLVVYLNTESQDDSVALLKHINQSSLEGVERIQFNDSLAMAFLQNKDPEQAEKFAVESAILLKQQLSKPGRADGLVIYPVLARLNQVNRPDLVFDLAKSLPPITPAMKRDPKWLSIECELANAYLAQNDLGKAKRIYMANIGDIRSLQDFNEILGSETIILTILFRQGDTNALLKEAKAFLSTVGHSNSVSASNTVASFLIQRRIDASSVVPEISVLAKSAEGKDPNRSMRLYEILAKIFVHSGKVNEAYDCYAKSEKLAKAVGNEQMQATAINGKMGCLIYLKKWTEFNTELAAARRLKDISGDDIFITEQMVGGRFEQDQQYEKAIKTYENLLAPYQGEKKIQLPTNYCDCVLHLALCYNGMGKQDLAIKAAERGITVARRAGKHSSAVSLYEYAAGLCEKSDPEKAAKFKRTAAKLHKVL